MTDAAPAEAVTPPPEPSSPAGPTPAEGRVNARALLAAAALALLAYGGGWLTARLSSSNEASRAEATREARDAGQALRAVQALEQRVARLESEGALVARVSAAGLAVVNLTAAAENPSGFAPALAAAERTLPASPDLVALRDLARTGAPTREGLAEAFPSVAARVRAALRRDGGGEALSGVGRALDRFFGRATPEPRGVGPEAALGRAEARLAAGDLAGAADALETLPSGAREAAADWISGARRRLEIDRRLAAVRLLALGQFAAVPQPQAQ
jgi:hypothetical protein